MQNVRPSKPLSFFGDKILKSIFSNYEKFEEFLINHDQQSTTDALKRKSLLIHMLFTGLCIVFTFIVDHNISFIKFIYYILALTLQLSVLHIFQGSFVIIYCLIYALFHLISFSLDDSRYLIYFGILFLNHQQFFFLFGSKLEKQVFLLMNIMTIPYLMSWSSNHTFNYQQSGIYIDTTNLVWIVVFLPNYFCSSSISKIYCESLQTSNQNKIELEELGRRNISIEEKLNNTLGLLSDSEKEKVELKNALRSRELFIASFTHEIRNSLNAIIGNVELLKLEIRSNEWLKLLETCRACAEIILDQINNVLDVTKINASKLEINNTPDDFLKTIERIWNISIIRMKQKNILGELYISNDLPRYLEIDSHRFTQVFLNLLGNATKFTKKGSIKVLISWHEQDSTENLMEANNEFLRCVDTSKQRNLSRFHDKVLGDSVCSGDDYSSSIAEYRTDQIALDVNRRVEQKRFTPKRMSDIQILNSIYISSKDDKSFSQLRLRHKSQQRSHGIIKLEIIDSGCGISKENIKKLFQPFTQANASITRIFGGTGLGLYITKQILEAARGKISIYSYEDIGSNFCVLLPAKTVNETEYYKNQAEVAYNQFNADFPNKMKCLLIIYNYSTNDFVAVIQYIKTFSIEVEISQSDQETIKLIRSKPINYYSFVMCELMSPFNQGLKICKEIRKIELESRGMRVIPLILVVDTIKEEEKIIWLNLKGDVRASHVCQKPIIIDEYTTCIQSILNKRFLNYGIKEQLPKILVVDDDPFNTSVIQKYIQNYGLSSTSL